MDFTLVEESAEQDEAITADLLPAGSVYIAPNNDTDANQCSYGETYRRAYRGGAFVAITADFPQPSIYVSLRLPFPPEMYLLHLHADNDYVAHPSVCPRLRIQKHAHLQSMHWTQLVKALWITCSIQPADGTLGIELASRYRCHAFLLSLCLGSNAELTQR